MTPNQQIDRAIVQALLPQLYVVIDDLLDHAQGAPKELVIRAKKLLPAIYPQSFEQSPLGKK
jgi:hypothetical protein